MKETFFNQRASEMWDFWPMVIVEPFYKGSFLDNTKLKESIEAQVDSLVFKRGLSWEAVDVKTG